ncbi:MAG: undecaprenyl-diphosphatase UppP [Kofleriaceae bacterium]
MPLWFAGVLGLVQGLTEFLPVSSTAHLRLAPVVFGQPDPGAAFTAVIQLGTLLAVIVYFARDLLVELPRGALRGPRHPDGRLPWLLVLGTLPIVVLGVLAKPLIVGEARSLWVVGGALAGVGLLLVVVDHRAARRGLDRGLAEVGVRDALLIGLAQAAALIPGVSRSGATLCMALALGLMRRDAARFSFLLGVPAIAGAAVLEFGDAIHALGADAAAPLAVATATAAISGYLAIDWLMRWLGSHRLTSFGVYRILLGAVVLALCGAGLITP